MNAKEFRTEIAMVAAIIGDTITKRLYPEVQKRDHGYIETISIIGQWAIEFATKHRNTNWEDVLVSDEGMKPLSKKVKEIICWDDAVIDFAEFKLTEYKKS